jgi:ABC-type amino acid transport substrate-binding protein
LRDLQRGLLDAVVLDNAGALTAVAEQRGLRIVEALSFEPYVLAVPPEAYVLHERVNAALAELERNGCLTALNERWMRQALPSDDTLPGACGLGVGENSGGRVEH